MPTSKITLVLIHGAWAECASWTEVILPLQKQGFGVVCAPLPLTSLSDDACALDRVLARIGGDIVLVGHADDWPRAVFTLALWAKSEPLLQSQIF